MSAQSNPSATDHSAQAQARQRHTLSIAPMMELTDRHYRHMMRSITLQTLLYTEMLTAKAVLHGEKERLLAYSAREHPVVLQLGGNDPGELAAAASIGQAVGFDEINLNVGCPSDRVQSGRFGACLMAEPELVGRCVQRMQETVSIPVTVKCRIGIDRNDSWESLEQFVSVVAGYGCTLFAVHARKAWLDGLSPKENRTIPPLRYEYVYQLKDRFPDLTIIINGGIDTWPAVHKHLQHVDGVMIGREAYYNPAFMLEADQCLYGSSQPPVELAEVARDYAGYMHLQHQQGVPLTAMTRHLVALYQGVPGARTWRRQLSEGMRDCQDIRQRVDDALGQLAIHQTHHANRMADSSNLCSSSRNVQDDSLR